MTIYDNIKELCKAKNTNIHSLEKSTGIGNGVIAGWKKYEPKVMTIKKVADYFGVSIEYFLEESERDAS